MRVQKNQFFFGLELTRAGEALPDIDKCKIMAELFDVSLDDLVNYDKQASGLGIPPKGKYMFGLVKVGDKGQIVIPAKARKIFGIEPGDNLVILGDETQGLALIVERSFMKLFNNLSS